MSDHEKIRKGVPGWVVALVAVACLFWGGVGGLVLGVFGDDIIEDVDPDPTAPADLFLTVGPGGKREAFDAQPGDCFQAVVNAEHARVTDVDEQVPCDTLHRAEVFARLDAPNGPSYGAEELDYFAYDGCILFFRDYFDRAYHDSELEVTGAIPSAAAWENGARTIVCLAHHPDGQPLTSPLKFSR